MLMLSGHNFFIQQLQATDNVHRLTSPPKSALSYSQKPSAIPVQQMNHSLSYHSMNKPPLQQQQQAFVAAPAPPQAQVLFQGTDKRYSMGSNGAAAPYKPSTSPIPVAPMSPKYPNYQATTQMPPSKLPLSTMVAATKNGNAALSSAAVPQGSRLKVVEKAMRARLYLLEHPGPNIFIVSGDSNENRFRVTVGIQVSEFSL